jgi:iron complex outermembrane recepter protein
VSYAYINTKLISTVPQPLPAPGYQPVSYSSTIGGVLPFTPTHKVAANLTYRLPVPDSLGKVSYNATWTYQSSQLVTVQSPFGFIRPYGLLDMNLNWSSLWGSPVDLELFASNVTNRLYYTGGDTPYATQYGFAVRLLGEPRMYGARVRVKFGK